MPTGMARRAPATEKTQVPRALQTRAKLYQHNIFQVKLLPKQLLVINIFQEKLPPKEVLAIDIFQAKLPPKELLVIDIFQAKLLPKELLILVYPFLDIYLQSLQIYRYHLLVLTSVYE